MNDDTKTSFCKPCSSDLPKEMFKKGNRFMRCCSICREKIRLKSKSRRDDAYRLWEIHRKAELEKLKINTDQCFWCVPIETMADIALFGLFYTTCDKHSPMEKGLNNLLMSLARGAHKKYRYPRVL